MKKISDLGRKRFERERAIKQKLKDDAAARSERAQDAMDAFVEKKLEKKQAAKDYRKNYRQREREILLEKQRKEKLRQEMEAKEKAKAEERKKQGEYMGSLHEQARIKREQEVAKLKREEEIDRLTREAQRKFRTRIEDLDRQFSKELEAASVAMQARKAVIDNNAKQKAYQLEGWRRMRTAALDTEMRNKMISGTAYAHGALDVERIKGDVQAQFRQRYKALEKDFLEKRAAIDMEARILKTGAENEMKAAHLRSEETLRLQKHRAETEHGMRLEEIQQIAKKKPKR